MASKYRVLQTSQDLSNIQLGGTPASSRQLRLARVSGDTITGWYRNYGRWYERQVGMAPDWAEDGVWSPRENWSKFRHVHQVLERLTAGRSTLRFVDCAVWDTHLVVVVVDILSYKESYDLAFGNEPFVVCTPPFRHAMRWSFDDAVKLEVLLEDITPASVISQSTMCMKWRHSKTGMFTRRQTTTDVWRSYRLEWQYEDCFLTPWKYHFQRKWKYVVVPRQTWPGVFRLNWLALSTCL